MNKQIVANENATVKRKSGTDTEERELEGDGVTEMGNVLETLTCAYDESETLALDIDDRLSYRQGWPLLPIFPVATITESVPARFSDSSTHMHVFRDLLKAAKVTTHDILIAHRVNPSIPLSKNTLTLCVLSDEANNKHWIQGIEKLRKYIQKNDLTLAVEIVDRRAFHGIYTHPLLETDKRIMRMVSRKRRAILDVVRGADMPFNKVYFYMRGLSRTRSECEPTVIIGTPVPNRRVWWEVVIPEIERIVGGKMDVEVVFEKREDC
ncbi:hypothetical protein P154DRAFT_234190 [Amniculicola lignicola CBS 123094]|uniref:Uncharacterized protein n=1 Tax=Amniculicola lignicola CBS 123094 TaxID=1392246 RepID=A0A6A5WCG3_9PLEO|nr:hypothetical protein P154DRAFT_234190 [Amniculicola lignicola CBS 123094]